MSSKVNVTDFPAQTVYLQDSAGDYIRHVWGTDEYWRLSPDKQIAIRYDTLFGRGKEGNAPYAIENGWVRAFRGSVEELVDFLEQANLFGTDLCFQDRLLTDDSSINLENYDSETKSELVADLKEYCCFEIFEEHLILFTSAEDNWHQDTRI